MGTYNPKTYRAILADMEAWIIANQDYITDFNEGSGITSFCEAVAQQIEQLYLRAKIGFIKYLPDLPFYAFGFFKHAGSTSVGVVKFSRNVANGEKTIPVGTVVGTPSGLLYTTTTEGTIAEHAIVSDDVSVEANDVGSNYNVPAHSITVMSTPPTGVDTVDNAVSTTGGTDEEDDNSFQQRFHDYVLGLGRGNVYGLIDGVMSVDGVKSASVIEHFPPLTGFYNVSVYIDDGTGAAPAELIADVEEVLFGDGSAEFPGYKPAGINLRVVAPTKVTVDVEVAITSTGEVDQAVIEANAQLAIEGYVNNLKLGKDLIYNELIDVLMDVAGVYDVDLTTPSGNITIGTTQVARTGTITISFVS